MTNRTYADRCPGVFRPWMADDGAIVRLRIPGGRVPAAALQALVEIAESYADGTVLLTKRANLQLRGISAHDGVLPDGLATELRHAGLLPPDTHELVRNIVSSPLTGRLGGRADLRPVVEALDAVLCADPNLADLGGRFLFVLDDGRGDVLRRPLDLGLVAVDHAEAQLRIGTDGWGPIVPITAAAQRLADLAREFRRLRGNGDTARWHVDELPEPRALTPAQTRDPRTQVSVQPIPAGPQTQDDGRLLDVVTVPDGLVTRTVAEQLLAYGAREYVVTPWRSIVVPDLEDA